MQMSYGASRSGVCRPGGRQYYPLYREERGETDLSEGLRLLRANVANLCTALGLPALTADGDLIETLNRVFESPNSARQLQLASRRLEGGDQTATVAVEDGWNLVTRESEY
eukprot:TRINITY_DN18362_c0_g1_i2.p2 TRINITY_DN18362_c0_g1~~TRINITY_DN18362_c0_g1_i2.p2  ORF type:complete len:111 (-),score=3.53 TRINITY_DN18362_c0_g1_i2:191-523(-)